MRGKSTIKVAPKSMTGFWILSRSHKWHVKKVMVYCIPWLSGFEISLLTSPFFATEWRSSTWGWLSSLSPSATAFTGLFDVNLCLLNVTPFIFDVIASQCHLQRAQGLVQLCAWQLLRIPPHIWLHYDDSSGIINLDEIAKFHNFHSALHQLQTEECCSSAMEDDDLQGKHIMDGEHVNVNFHRLSTPSLTTYLLLWSKCQPCTALAALGKVLEKRFYRLFFSFMIKPLYSLQGWCGVLHLPLSTLYLQDGPYQVSIIKVCVNHHVAFRVNEFGVSAEMLEKKEEEGAVVDTAATPALEGCEPEGPEGAQEAPKSKQKSKKAKKVD